MKRVILISSLLFASLGLLAQNDCRPFIPQEVGTLWEITNYTPKGKEDGMITYELLDKQVDGTNVTYTVQTLTYDKKGEEVFSTTFEAYCTDGKFEFDMAYKMDGGAMQSYQDMDMEIDASKYEIPDLDAAPGTQLPDGTMDVRIVVGGAMNINMNVAITDRVIENPETITTPAGTFDCVVMSQNVRTKMIVNIQAASKEWYAEGVGVIRTESFNKKGKLTGYSELTNISLP